MFLPLPARGERATINCHTAAAAESSYFKKRLIRDYGGDVPYKGLGPPDGGTVDVGNTAAIRRHRHHYHTGIRGISRVALSMRPFRVVHSLRSLHHSFRPAATGDEGNRATGVVDGEGERADGGIKKKKTK